MPACVTGMHRSGTSMVAHLLHLSGVYLGDPQDLFTATSHNQDGHWEHTRFIQLNDDILDELGAGWDCPSPAHTEWRDLFSVPRVRLKADALLREFKGRGLDPVS